MPSCRRSLYAAGLVSFLWIVPAFAGNICQPGHLCSRTFTATGKCTGLDQVAILETPWETQAITIRAVTTGILTQPPTQMVYAFAGNSYQPDVMALQIGSGSRTERFPEGIGFPLPGSNERTGAGENHVDLHVSCVRPAPPPPPIPKTFTRRQWERLFPPAVAAVTPADRGADNYQAWLVVYYELSR